MKVGDGSVALFVKAPTVMQDDIDWAESVEETDEASMKVVLLMPSKVLLTVTGVPLEEEEKDASSYRFRDLRMGMLVMSHEFQLHAKVGLMYLFVTQKAWWPTIKVVIDRYIGWCGICSAKIKAARLAGHGMVSVCSLRHIGADHVVLPE